MVNILFIGRTDVEAETPILWLPDAKSWLIWKDPDAGKDWGQEEKGMTEDKMAKDITESMDMGLGGLQDLGVDREAWHAAVHGVAKSRTLLSDWTELNYMTQQFHSQVYTRDSGKHTHTKPIWRFTAALFVTAKG